MPSYPITGIDLNTDPVPGVYRDLKTNRGISSGSGRARQLAFFANKLAGSGNTTNDGRGDLLNTPILITEGEQEITDRAGFGSEAQIMYRTIVRRNPDQDVWLCLMPPGSGAATFTWTFVGASSADGAMYIDCMGDTTSAALVNQDAIAVMAASVAAAINAQINWPVTASASLGVVTVTAKTAGTRHAWHPTQMRLRFSRPNTTVATKSAVSGTSTDDDMTLAITAFETAGPEVYYHISPKAPIAATTTTDLGAGQHAASIGNMRLPINGRATILIVGCTGTNSNATAVGISLNSEWCAVAWAKNSDYSPAQLAATMAAIKSSAETSDKAANLMDYGRDGRFLGLPAPFVSTDRPARTELKAALNNGVSPFAFDSNGNGYLVYQITTRSLTSSVQDYRCRAGHIPSVVDSYWDAVRAGWFSIRQPKWSPTDPGEGEKPIYGFSYPRDASSLMKRTIDDKVDAGELDPAQRAFMKQQVEYGTFANGPSMRAQIAAARHNTKGGFLIEEISAPN